MLAKYTDIERATERLRGIMMGIALDNKVTDDEILQLSDWLKLHQYLHDKEPFKSVVRKVTEILDDHIIDEDEREEILELCWMFDSESLIPQCATAAIRRLHGVLHGIVIDGEIQENEVIGLKSWLEVHDYVKDYWPFSDIWEMVFAILQDGKIDASEKRVLLDYCQNFSEKLSENPKIHDAIYDDGYMANLAPILQPFTAICDRTATIVFRNNTFCFTGPAKTGSRKKLNEMVENLGGIPKNNVAIDLNYLVIGAQSSPCWIYSTYGRKIEQVFKNKKKGGDTIILHEDDFIEQSSIY